MMKSSNKCVRLALGLSALVLAASSAGAQEWGYEGYYDFEGDYPSDDENGWSEQAQGLANDGVHWYTVSNNKKVPLGDYKRIFKASAADVSLTDIGPGFPGVIWQSVNSLGLDAYNVGHIGDPVCIKSPDGTWYVVVPCEGSPGHGMAFLRCSDLGLAAYIPVPFQSGSDKHNAWVGAHPDGRLFSARGFYSVTTLHAYSVDWSSGNQFDLTVSDPDVTLFDEVGAPLLLENLQGGEFSITGELLYLVAEGIHVFDTTTWRRVMKSSRTSGPFYFDWEDGWLGYQEPEGMTIWDLDDGQAYGVHGQLHVVLLDNDTGTDEIWVKHYSHRIWVDGTVSGSGDGEWDNPFREFSSAAAAAWPRSEIRVKPGQYAFTGTITTRTLVTADQGTCVVN